MTILNDLSTEILLQIFSLLPCRDLAASCLVSRRWLELNEQPLYTKVSFPATGLDNFATTITSRPGFATNVRSVRINWESGISSTVSDVRLVHLQQLLPSLVTIDILPPFNRPLRDPFPAGVAPTFQSLREFTWHRHGDPTGLSATQLLMLLLLPSLRRLTAHMAPGPGMDSIDPRLIRPYYRDSGVTHLTLQHGNMTARSLTLIMTLTGSLTHFSYADTHLDPLGGWDLLMFHHALACVRSTLQSLTLGMCSVFEDDQRWGMGGAMILCGWPALTKVEASMVALLGVRESVLGGFVNVLPMGLKELVVVVGSGDWEVADVVHQVDKMVVSGVLRSLEMVTIRGLVWGDGAHEGLRAVCDMAGVQLVVECE